MVAGSDGGLRTAKHLILGNSFGVGLHAGSLITVALALPTIMHTGTGVASDLAQPDHTAARGQLSTEPAPV